MLVLVILVVAVVVIVLVVGAGGGQDSQTARRLWYAVWYNGTRQGCFFWVATVRNHVAGGTTTYHGT
jgi:hypothetical protein